ncbi:MAG: hypothetical protein V4737_08755 [Curtobacterium sp.]
MALSGKNTIVTVYGTPVEVTHDVDLVRVRVGERVPFTLEPGFAAALADELKEQAQNAIHAERVGRRL